MRGVLLALSMCCLVAVSLSNVHPAAAQQVTMRVIPDSLVVTEGRENRAFVVLQNMSGDPLSALRLSYLPDAAIQVRFTDGPPVTVPPKGTVATTVSISGTAGTKRPSIVVLRADYRSGSALVPGVVVGSISLVADRFETASQAVDISLSASAGTITEREPRTIYLLVTNKTDLPLEVEHIRARGASFADADRSIDTLRPRGIIPAHAVGAFDVTMRAKQRVHPGKYTVVFDVGIRWTSYSGPRTGNLVQPLEVDVGVFGESAVLKVLSVPSFLLLPGFLMVIAGALMWQYLHFRRGVKAGDFPLKPSAPDFWVVAITLSTLMAVLSPRDYLDAYGTRDLVEVWLASVVLGVIGSLAWFMWVFVLSAPSSNDGPLAILRKLSRQRLSIELEIVELAAGQRRFLLQRRPQDNRAFWVGPTITVAWEAVAQPGDRDRFNSLLENRKPRPLLRYLRRAQARHVLRVGWDPAGAVPALIPQGSFVGTGLIVEAK